MSKLRIAFIGLGGIAKNAHLPALKGLGYKVDFCVDIDTGRVKEFTENVGCKGYADYREMLKNENPDVVLVATPHAFHAQIAVDALENGSHVYIEKPMALTVEEATKIVDVAHRKNRFIVVGHNGRFSYRNYTAAKIIHKGVVGKIYYARGFILRQRGIPPAPTFLKKELARGGAVYDIASHALDMLLYFIGYSKPVSVKGFTYRAFGERVDEFGGTYPQPPIPGLTSDVEDFGSAFISFDNGIAMYVEVSWAGYLKESKVEYVVLGDRGGVHVDNTNLYYISSAGKELFVGSHVGLNIHVDTYAEVWKKLLNAIEKNDEACLCPATTAEQGFINTAILESIYKSSMSGKEVELNIPDKIVEHAKNQLKCLVNE